MYVSLGALIAVGWVTYCLFPAIDEWFSDRREMREMSWSRLSEQDLRVDKWSVCRG